ncbi:MAG: DUF6702 family protein [Bacteroidota bacterium]
MKSLKPLLILLIVPFFSFIAHKYYISMTKINYVKEEKALQITMRFFTDDVEKTLNNRFKKEFELDTKSEHTETDKFINLYIHQKLQIKINESKIDYTFLGKEYDNDVVYFYLESTDIDNIKSIEIKNRMLFEEFKEQQNFIKTNINDQKHTFILMINNDKEMLKY